MHSSCYFILLDPTFNGIAFLISTQIFTVYICTHDYIFVCFSCIPQFFCISLYFLWGGASVMLSGEKLKHFPLRSGTKQGYRLTPSLCITEKGVPARKLIYQSQIEAKFLFAGNMMYVEKILRNQKMRIRANFKIQKNSFFLPFSCSIISA